MSIKLQPGLLAQLEQVAAKRAVASEKLLEDAVRNFLREVDRNKIKAEAVAYRKMHVDLMRDYLGQYVAIHNGELYCG